MSARLAHGRRFESGRPYQSFRELRESLLWCFRTDPTVGYKYGYRRLENRRCRSKHSFRMLSEAPLANQSLGVTGLSVWLEPAGKSTARSAGVQMDTLIVCLMVAQLAVSIYMAWKTPSDR